MLRFRFLMAFVFCALLPAAPLMAEPHYARVTGVASDDVLNMRSGPSTQYGIVGALANGDTVQNIGCETHGGSRWCRVALLDEMGGQGWVNARYLQDAEAPAHHGSAYLAVHGVASNDVLNLRSGPGTGHAIVGALGNGDKVRNLGCETHGGARWCRVVMPGDMGGEGWANARYLRPVAR